jgi:hypothetical protein
LEEVLKSLSAVGIDIEDLKKKLKSGEWMIVEGDSECVLNVVAFTHHSAILLFVIDDNALCLAKKTETFMRLSGLSSETLKRIVWMQVMRVHTGCTATASIEDKPDEVVEDIVKSIIDGAKIALERVKNAEQGDIDLGYIQ